MNHEHEDSGQRRRELGPWGRLSLHEETSPGESTLIWTLPASGTVSEEWKRFVQVESRAPLAWVEGLEEDAGPDGELRIRIAWGAATQLGSPEALTADDWKQPTAFASRLLEACEPWHRAGRGHGLLRPYALLGEDFDAVRVLPPLPLAADEIARRTVEATPAIDSGGAWVARWDLACLGRLLKRWVENRQRPLGLDDWIANASSAPEGVGFASTTVAQEALEHILAESNDGAPAAPPLDRTNVTPPSSATVSMDATNVRSDWFPTPGEEFAGFRIEEQIGVGGMGVVFRATDQSLERPCAIKVLRPEMLGRSGRVRFLREARACSRITHPHVVVIYSTGVAHEIPFIAMEYLQGRTLHSILQQERPSWERAVRWLREVLSGLAQHHRMGIVHRDLKPENIMITAEDSAKLMDFGIAHMATETAVTRTGQVLGTVRYMSPEQVDGREATPRSDVFSAGIILFESLAGVHPFQGEDQMSVMYAIVQRKPGAFTPAEGVPSELRSIVRKALSKSPDDRYADASEFAAELDTLLEGLPAPRQRARAGRVIGLTLAGILSMAAVWWWATDPEPYDRETAQLHNAQGLALREENPEAALTEYRSAILADPTLAVAWNNLGLLVARQGDLAEGDSLLQRAIELDPTYAVAWFNRGTVAWDSGRHQDAESYYRRALEIDSNMHTAAVNLGSLLLELDRPEAAKEISARALAADSLSSVAVYLHRNLARAFTALNRPGDAIRQWNEVLQSEDPTERDRAVSALQELDSPDRR